MMVFYNHILKKLGLEKQEFVHVPKKIARRITMLSAELKPKDKEKE